MPIRTSFWPYATTIFDYVRRAMPLNESKSLTPDETYAVAAYLLQINDAIGENDTINAQTLPAVRMHRDGFVTFSREVGCVLGFACAAPRQSRSHTCAATEPCGTAP